MLQMVILLKPLSIIPEEIIPIIPMLNIANQLMVNLLLILILLFQTINYMRILVLVAEQAMVTEWETVHKELPMVETVLLTKRADPMM